VQTGVFEKINKNSESFTLKNNAEGNSQIGGYSSFMRGFVLNPSYPDKL